MPTATLTIENFETTLRLTHDDPNQPAEVINVVGGSGDMSKWREDFDRRRADPTAYLLAGADAELAKRGYARAGDWQRGPERNERTAPITAA